jgi:hypothetical protein
MKSGWESTDIGFAKLLPAGCPLALLVSAERFGPDLTVVCGFSTESPSQYCLSQSLTILNWGCRVQLKPGTYWESTVSGIASPRGVIPVSHIVPLDQQGKPRLPRRESGLVLIVAGAVTKGDGLEGGGEVGVQVPAAIDAGGFDEAAEIDGETFEVDGDSGARSRIRSSSS